MVFLRPQLLLLTLTSILITHQAYSKDDRKTYIVYMGDHPNGINPASLPSLHTTMAQNVLGSDFAQEAILHSYWKSFNGFVMKLTEEEAKTIAGMDGVVSVFLNGKFRPHTTRSWDFIGFPQKVRRRALKSDIIVGVIDSGIWPESESFSDKGFGPPPAKWKGSCHNFTCNNKIIGAKYSRIDGSYEKDDIKSPRDNSGHGTHTASTVAGNLVGSASLQGLGSGTAGGGVPSARIAVYKVCWLSEVDSCDYHDILAGFDEAIADGVDIISISLGGEVPIDIFMDPIAIGAFHAMKRGILTSKSAGNKGPGLYTIATLAPWLLSVAATTTDRKFSTKLQLGNGLVYKGVSVNTFDLKGKYYPFIDGGDAPNVRGGYNSSESRFCKRGSLDRKSVKGKIILCDQIFQDTGVSSEVAGIVVSTTSFKDAPDVRSLPEIEISYADGLRIRSFLKSNSTATIFKTNEEKDSSAPYVASFSSRGPNPLASHILKPDISAPGVDILAAWPPISPISLVKGDKRVEHYNIISGTSMACPHATAAAAYVKSFHPKWSPSAIKSALMTTAVPLSSAMNPDAEFAYGAGQINPVKAVNPGLVYDASENDYVKFLCSQGYDNKKLRSITGDYSSCGRSKNETVDDLNLPSFASKVPYSSDFIHVSHRTVTNVGSSKSKYRARITAPPVLNIQVSPQVLSFTSVGQKKSFALTMEGKSIDVDIVSASLVWDDGTFQVRSPIVVYNDLIAFNPDKEAKA